MKAIHNCRRQTIFVDKRCVKLVKDNENESNSQQAECDEDDEYCCVKLVKDNENESNSQPISVNKAYMIKLCEAGQR